MEHFAGIESQTILIFVLAVGFVAGLVKGMVGFAMPMILMSGLTLVMPPEQALAALILPALVTNLWQAVRQGWANAVATMRDFRVFLIVGFCVMVLSAQLVPYLSARVLYGLIGGPVALFGVVQLLGWRPRTLIRSTRAEAIAGGVAGFTGGLSGIWGPPTVLYLTAVNTPKREQMGIQGVIYGLGALTLVAAHVQTGVLGPQTLPLTLALVPFGLLGIWIGFKIQDRIHQDTFRKLTLLVLVVAGLNLLRRAVMG